jgi:hypothetical protein
MSCARSVFLVLLIVLVASLTTTRAFVSSSTKTLQGSTRHTMMKAVSVSVGLKPNKKTLQRHRPGGPAVQPATATAACWPSVADRPIILSEAVDGEICNISMRLSSNGNIDFLGGAEHRMRGSWSGDQHVFQMAIEKTLTGRYGEFTVINYYIGISEDSIGGRTVAGKIFDSDRGDEQQRGEFVVVIA